MNALYIAITAVAGLFFVASGVLLPLFDLADSLPGRRKARSSSSITTPARAASAPGKPTEHHHEKIAA